MVKQSSLCLTHAHGTQFYTIFDGDWLHWQFITDILEQTINPTYTGCHRRNGPNFGRVFLMLNYTDITQNTYIQS